MTAPLTTAELAELERDANCETWQMPRNAHILRLIAEIRATRELLATPTDPAGMEQPEVVAIVDGTYSVAWGLDLEDCGDMQPVEAIGYGAALIRAALAARARAGREG